MGAKATTNSMTSVINVRLPEQMIQLLDTYVAAKVKEGMGLPYTRSDAIRDAVAFALLEKLGKKKKGA